MVTEILSRGLTPVLAGRNPAALAKMGLQHPTLDIRAAAVNDLDALDSAMGGVGVVVNCAGPFLDTGLPMAAASIRAGAHYLDISAEQAAVQQIYRAYDKTHDDIEGTLIPATAFYGGLADLLATTATSGWEATDTIDIAIGIDRWWPTPGTRETGRRNTATRLVVDHGVLTSAPAPAPVREWVFQGSLGRQRMIASPFSEIVAIARHLNVSTVRTYLTTSALDDVRNAHTAAPTAVDTTGRSAQQFVVEVLARRGTAQRRISAAGQDIYAVSAPLVAEAADRLLNRRANDVRGATTLGEAFDARDFLEALSATHLTLKYE